MTSPARGGDREASRESVALGSGSDLGALVLFGVGREGVMIPAEVGALIGGGVAGFALLVGRRGISGLLGFLWCGDQEPAGAQG